MVFSRSDRGAMRVCMGALLAALACGVVGCGPSEPFDLVPVSGSVVCEDGSLDSAARIELSFTPQVEPIDPKTHPPPGTADVNIADRTFAEASSHRYGDGLVVGKHKVRLFCYDKKGVPSELVVEPSEIEVGSGSNQFKFQTRKKGGRTAL